MHPPFSSGPGAGVLRPFTLQHDSTWSVLSHLQWLQAVVGDTACSIALAKNMSLSDLAVRLVGLYL